MLKLLNFAIDQLAGLFMGATLAAAALVLYNVAIENPSVRKDERMLVESEARARAMALIQKRSEDNVEISKQDNAQLCAELGGRWVSNENRCD